MVTEQNNTYAKFLSLFESALLILFSYFADQILRQDHYPLKFKNNNAPSKKKSLAIHHVLKIFHCHCHLTSVKKNKTNK